MKTTKFDEAYIELTSYCNLECKHCYNLSDIKGKHLSRENFFLILNFLKLHSIKQVYITGGEAFTHPYLLEFLKEIKNKKIEVSTIFTNATLIEKYKKEKLREILSLCKSITISLEGCRKSNDCIRGKGSFDKAINGLKIIKKIKHGYKICINTIIHKGNSKDIHKLYNLIKKNRISDWIILIPHLCGRLKKNSIFYLNNPSETVESLTNILIKFLKNPVENLSIKAGYFPKMPLDINEIIDYSNSVTQCSKCEYSKSLLIKNDLRVYGCPALAEHEHPINYLGKIGEEIINKEIGVLVYKISRCKNCRYLSLCGGGCPAENYSETSSFAEGPTFMCETMEKMEKKIIPLLPKKIKKKLLFLIKNEKRFKSNLRTC